VFISQDKYSRTIKRKEKSKARVSLAGCQG